MVSFQQTLWQLTIIYWLFSCKIVRNIEELYIINPRAMQILTIYASLYQNKSEYKSVSVKWGSESRLCERTSKLYDRSFYGYRQNSKGKLEIHPEEVENVKMIVSGISWACL